MDGSELDTLVVDPSSSESHEARERQAADSLAESLAGIIDRLGRYRLVEGLGRGAFGTVWAAYDPELDRKVAIKIVRGKLRGGGSTRARATNDLIAEAQLLAQLSHPNVVAIHDVGHLDEAQVGQGHGVYIVMEHLDGPSLEDWMAGERSPAEVVGVFLEAGRGLQAAHERDLVHLDFKPANAMFGDDGRLRVLDFGLARALHQTEDANVLRGTPRYMAPEQFTGKSPDARADQYAFCVALWHALHGEPPYPGADYHEIARAKVMGPPQRPRDSPARPHVLAALERGMMPLPEQRFASMAELLAALEHDPAHRRRRIALGGALLLATAALGYGLSEAREAVDDPCALAQGALVGVWDEPRRRAVAEGFEATGASFAAETFAEVSALLDEHVGEWTQTRRELCRAALVDKTASVETMGEQMLCLDRQLRRVAELSASLTEADVELVAQAVGTVRQLERPERCRGTGADEVEAEAEVAVAGEAALAIEDQLAEAEVAELFGRYAAGLEASGAAIETADASGDALARARAHGVHSRLLRELGRNDESLEHSHAGLAAAAELDLARASALELELLVDAVVLHTERGAFDTAVAVAEIAAPRVDPQRDPRLAGQLHLHAGAAHTKLERWDASIAQLEAGLAVLEAAYGPEDPSLAKVHLQLGNTLSASSREPERALDHYRRAIALWTAAYGERHPVIGKAQLNLAGVYFRRGDHASAVEPLEAALALFEDIYPSDHPTIGVARQNLGALLVLLGRFEDALGHIEYSCELLGARLGKDHVEYAQALRNLGSTLILVGRPGEAREHLEDAATIYAGALEANDSRVVLLASERAEAAWWLGEDETFAAHVATIEATLPKSELNDHRRVSPVSMLVVSALARGDAERALALAREVVQFMTDAAGEDHPDTARARAQVAEALRRLGRLEEARGELERGLAALQREAGEHPFAWELRVGLAELELELGHPGKAAQVLEPARAGLDPGLFRALVELELAKVLAGRDPERARALARAAKPVIEELGPRPEHLAALDAVLEP